MQVTPVSPSGPEISLCFVHPKKRAKTTAGRAKKGISLRISYSWVGALPSGLVSPMAKMGTLLFTTASEE